MITIEAIFIGQPQQLHDENGSWYSAIFRQPVQAPVLLTERGLVGDQVADSKHHGSLDQAVCCHPLAHYDYWRTIYPNHPMLAAGGVGENWTIGNLDEKGVCVGDVVRVGTAIVQVSGPRYPCWKQGRKLQIAGFHEQTMATLRTGWYGRVLRPGRVQPHDEWQLEERPHPQMTIWQLNQAVFDTFDPAFAHYALTIPELSATWQFILRRKLSLEGSSK